ncbi:MAG: hypothetical protein J6I60_07410 [Bacteroidaceae bacterium]|nr:hypothetical protein [Bacteroidaceae bacterium]
MTVTKKIFRVLLLTLFVGQGLVRAQSKDSLRYCMSFDEYKAGKWQTMTDVECVNGVKRSKSTYMWSRVFQTADAQQTEMLKKDVYAVMYHDTLFINTDRLKYMLKAVNRHYVQAYPYEDDKLIFAGIGGDANKAALYVDVGALFGMVGGITIAITTESYSPRSEQEFLYKTNAAVVNGNHRRINMMGENKMYLLLHKHNKTLRDKFAKVVEKTNRCSALHVLLFLSEAGLVKWSLHANTP